jgi:hypothetical protein
MKKADYPIHPPGGSNVPGKVEANPYIFYPPKVLREMIPTEQDEEEKAKMVSALKQYERIYTYPGYPWRMARKVAANFLKVAEVPYPSLNIPYYQDAERTQGDIEIYDSLRGLYDNEDNIRLDYNRQGERPVRDDIDESAFLNPKEPPFGDSVKERGSGPDPEGMETCEPPTGGEMGGLSRSLL